MGSVDQKTHRLHISGHPRNITAEGLAARFSPFGSVTCIDRLGILDGNGDASTYLFLELQTDQKKLDKCINLLSGSTWKGSTFKIALAVPDYKARMATDMEQASIAGTSSPGQSKDKRKRKRELRAVDGYEAMDRVLVDTKNVESRKVSRSMIVRPMAVFNGLFRVGGNRSTKAT